MRDLFDLQVFVRAVELQSLAAAARSLKASKTSVSRSLARLEDSLGMALIERSTRNLRPTDAGALFYPYAHRILTDVEEADAAMSSFAGAPRGTLRVSTSVSFSQCILAPMLPAFLERHPAVRVIVDVDNRKIDLLAQQTDLAIRLGKLEDSALIARRIATFELWFCASPDYLARQGTPCEPNELTRHRFVGRDDFSLRIPAAHVDRHQGVDDVEVSPTVVISDAVTLQAVLAGGGGIGRLPDFLADPMIRAGTLVRILPALTPQIVEAYAVYPSHRSLSAKVRAFIDALVEYLEATRPSP